jgi:hypothetical protein
MRHYYLWVDSILTHFIQACKLEALVVDLVVSSMDECKVLSSRRVAYIWMRRMLTSCSLSRMVLLTSRSTPWKIDAKP